MGTHMKTTIDLPDTLFRSAKRLAEKRETTLRALVEEGLRRVINDEPAATKTAFKLRDARTTRSQLLLPNPHDWQTLEDSHVSAALMSVPAPHRTNVRKQKP
jgi:hypothetical protein